MKTIEGTSLGAKIRFQRKRKGLTLIQLQDLTGIDNGNLSRIERGDQGLTEETMTRIAAGLDISLGQLCDTFDDRLAPLGQHQPVLIPYKSFITYKAIRDLPAGANVLINRIVVTEGSNEVPAGWQASEAEPLVFSGDQIRHLQSEPKHLLACQITDETMAPRLFLGDQVLIDRYETSIPTTGGVFALVFAGELLVRRVFKRPSNGLTLLCDNRDYPAIDLRADEVTSITIIGRVKFRSGAADF